MALRSVWLCFVAAALPIGAVSGQPSPSAPVVPAGLRPLSVPQDNPITAEKVELGRLLYFDPRLSSDDTVSCASCHDPKKGWSNGEPVATGIRGLKGGRSAPTIVNAGYQSFQFWDGRAWQLEGQALGPIHNPIEMDMQLDALVVGCSNAGRHRQGDCVL
jgi:cytochrome c peroxidase